MPTTPGAPAKIGRPETVRTSGSKGNVFIRRPPLRTFSLGEKLRTLRENRSYMHINKFQYFRQFGNMRSAYLGSEQR